jgi:hypothetical protein
MNVHRIAVATIILTACPQNDSTDHADEIGLEVSSGTPDLPGVDSSTESTSESTESTSDGENESTENDSTSDGSMDEIDGGTGDETGSEAVPTSLIVESAGQRIGYLTGVWDYGYLVWDDVAEIQFTINQQTGHIVGGGDFYYYATANCTGQRYQLSGYASVPNCADIQIPFRRRVVGDSIDGDGFGGSLNLVAPTGQAIAIMLQSYKAGAQCNALVVNSCAYSVQVTNVIPKTFALPITVVETQAVP